MTKYARRNFQLAKRVKDILLENRVHPKLDPSEIRFIFLAGSSARGVAAKKSDIDIIVVTDKTTIDKQEFREHLKKFYPNANRTCVFIYDFKTFLKSLENRLNDKKITKKRLQPLFLKTFSTFIDKIAQGPLHRRISKALRKKGVIKDTPLSYTLEEQASLVALYERNPGEWHQIIGPKLKGISKVFYPGGEYQIVRDYLSGKLELKEARQELAKLPTLWKKEVKNLMKSESLTKEEKKRLKRLLWGAY